MICWQHKLAIEDVRIAWASAARVAAMRLLAAVLIAIPGSVMLRAETAPKDPNLPHVQPEALERLSETRIRQRIMQHSLAPYAARCVCPYQTQDARGHSCKGRHEVVTTSPQPICYPRQVTSAMITHWKQTHASR
jgi:hypothetical protein